MKPFSVEKKNCDMTKQFGHQTVSQIKIRKEYYGLTSCAINFFVWPCNLSRIAHLLSDIDSFPRLVPKN